MLLNELITFFQCTKSNMKAEEVRENKARFTCWVGIVNNKDKITFLTNFGVQENEYSYKQEIVSAMRNTLAKQINGNYIYDADTGRFASHAYDSHRSVFRTVNEIIK